jgi:hypothetical protein
MPCDEDPTEEKDALPPPSIHHPRNTRRGRFGGNRQFAPYQSPCRTIPYAVTAESVPTQPSLTLRPPELLGTGHPGRRTGALSSATFGAGHGEKLARLGVAIYAGLSLTSPRRSSSRQVSGWCSRSVSHAIDHSAWLAVRPGLPRLSQGFLPIVQCTPKLCGRSVRMELKRGSIAVHASWNSTWRKCCSGKP